MEKKTRIYELAKELNTTSKRLIEKLKEINVDIKNHMSFLNEEQLKALYDHIGVITHKEEEQGSGDTARKQMPRPPMPERKKQPPSREKTKGPRIIRKTEIILDSDGEDYYRGRGGHNKKPERRRRRDYVKVADDTSGLRAGLVRDTGSNLANLRKTTKEKKETEEVKKKRERIEIEKKEAEELKKRKDEELKQKETEKIRKREEDFKKKEAEEQKRKEAEKPKEVEKPKETKKPKEVEKQKETRKQKDTKRPKEKEAKREKAEDVSEKPEEKKVIQDKRKDKAGEKVSKPKARKRIDESAKKEKKRPGTTGKKYDGRSKSGAVDRVTKEKRRDEQKASGTPGKTIRPNVSGDVTKKDFQKPERRSYPKTKVVKDRELKKDVGKPVPPVKRKKFSSQNIIIGGKEDISEIFSDGFEFEEYIQDFGKKKKSPGVKKEGKEKQEKLEQSQKSVKIPDNIVIKNLAEKLKKTATEVIKKLMGLGMMVTINEEVDFETASIVADEFGIKVEKEVVVSEEDILFDDSDEENDDNLVTRAPVVVVMGHVDHGKTSLLDAIRKENVIDTEAGGITQHIGAYTVTINDREITFIDTPGHEAFTSLRARGAQITDIAILVVAADDGVMPQTIEAINHAKAANISIIVAINKMDLPGANPDRVKQQLTEHGLLPEEWGGDVICVPVSAKNMQNLDELLDMVLLTADVLELKANPDRQAKGTIIEAKLDKTRGVIATLLVQRGTLKHGDPIVAGTAVGRIRAMTDDKGIEIEKATPSVPVEVLGLSEVPNAGEVFYAIEDEKVARQLVEKRKDVLKKEQMKTTAKVSLEELYSQIQEGNVKELNIIVKADTQGSVEAVKHSFEKIKNDEVKIQIIHGGVGAVTESDVHLAEVANALIIGFNIRTGVNVMEMAKNAEVDIKFYRVIYEAIDDIEAAIKGMLDPKYRELVMGHAEVRQIFKVPGVGAVAGCYITDGKVTRNSEVRLVRDGIVIYEGELASLKRFKDDAREVAQGYECGIGLEKFNDVKEGDIIEAYTMEQVER